VRWLWWPEVLAAGWSGRGASVGPTDGQAEPDQQPVRLHAQRLRRPAVALGNFSHDGQAQAAAPGLDGASLPRIYWRSILPVLRPVVFSTILVLAHLSIKSFDLVMALTNGGPGYATDVSATLMFVTSFTRGQIGLG